MSDFPFRATILIPVYNVEKYLNGCINSLIEQTEPFGNMEILLINDGSRDGSAISAAAGLMNMRISISTQKRTRDFQRQETSVCAMRRASISSFSIPTTL